jgi:tetrapyrrole methylase family protein / MazG family protein
MHTDPSPAFERLLGIVRRLRGPDGCPWDNAQTPLTLREGLIEESYECVAAIDAGDEDNLKEELGDLYLLVTLLAWMKEQEGAFTVAGVLEGISEKLIRRHPHVFADSTAGSVSDILVQWQAIKEREKGPDRPSSALEGIPGSLPPLERAAAVQRRVARVGFDWPEAAPVWDKLHEEIGELREAVSTGDSARIEDEVGDVLFTVVNLSRMLKTDPSLALGATIRKFERRFRGVEAKLREEGLDPAGAGLARMDAIWNQLKREERGSEGSVGPHSTSK